MNLEERIQKLEVEIAYLQYRLARYEGGSKVDYRTATPEAYKCMVYRDDWDRGVVPMGMTQQAIGA